MNTEKFLLDLNGWVPNNQGLPVLIYRSVESGAREQIAKAFEKRFADHGWPAKWRDTIFDYHHYPRPRMRHWGSRAAAPR